MASAKHLSFLSFTLFISCLLGVVTGLLGSILMMYLYRSVGMGETQFAGAATITLLLLVTCGAALGIAGGQKISAHAYYPKPFVLGIGMGIILAGTALFLLAPVLETLPNLLVQALSMSSITLGALLGNHAGYTVIKRETSRPRTA